MITPDTILTIDLLTDDRPERFHGTPEAIVTAMNDTAFSRCDSPQAYMARWNKFYEGFHGRTFRTDSYATFVEDMLAAGVAVTVDSENANG